MAEEEGRRLQAEDPAAQGGFWVRDRKNNGLIYVVPNADPEEETHRQQERLPFGEAADASTEVLSEGSGGDFVIGQGSDEQEEGPQLSGHLEILGFIEEKRALTSVEFRQAAFDAGLDPDRDTRQRHQRL